MSETWLKFPMCGRLCQTCSRHYPKPACKFLMSDRPCLKHAWSFSCVVDHFQNMPEVSHEWQTISDAWQTMNKIGRLLFMCGRLCLMSVRPYPKHARTFSCVADHVWNMPELSHVWQTVCLLSSRPCPKHAWLFFMCGRPCQTNIKKQNKVQCTNIFRNIVRAQKHLLL